MILVNKNSLKFHIKPSELNVKLVRKYFDAKNNAVFVKKNLKWFKVNAHSAKNAFEHVTNGLQK